MGEGPNNAKNWVEIWTRFMAIEKRGCKNGKTQPKDNKIRRMENSLNIG